MSENYPCAYCDRPPNVSEENGFVTITCSNTNQFPCYLYGGIYQKSSHEAAIQSWNRLQANLQLAEAFTRSQIQADSKYPLCKKPGHSDVV